LRKPFRELFGPPRSTQLSWFEPGHVIKQDQELIDLINNSNYTQALACGDVDFFADYVEFLANDTTSAEFCIFIINRSFKFNELVTELNSLIKNQLTNNSFIYLSINKYIALPDRYDVTLSVDYDIAIHEFISKNVHAHVEKYFPCNNDGGNQFNWVHPLTRFHLRVNK
jgi:hypothetical protein